MTLSIGDHLLINRNGKTLGPEDEGHHEFEVMSNPYAKQSIMLPDGKTVVPPEDTTDSWFQDKTEGVDYHRVQWVALRVVK